MVALHHEPPERFQLERTVAHEHGPLDPSKLCTPHGDNLDRPSTAGSGVGLHLDEYFFGSPARNRQRKLHSLGGDPDYPLHRYYLWAKKQELQLGGATPSLLRLGKVLADTPV